MNATLVPTERSEEIAQFEEHWDDAPQCAECEQPATVTARKVCCPIPYSFCPTHYAELRVWVTKHLTVGIACTRCHAQYATPQTFTDMFTVVTL